MLFKGKGSVYDSENKKLLCTFVDGEYNTEDAREIRLLKTVKSITYDKESIQEPSDSAGLTRKEMISIAKELGIKGSDRMSRDELEEAIK